MKYQFLDRIKKYIYETGGDQYLSLKRYIENYLKHVLIRKHKDKEKYEKILKLINDKECSIESTLKDGPNKN